MFSKNIQKEKAVSLRRQGLSYSEILKNVPVAKSTLSLWFKDVGLSNAQKQRLTKKRIKSALRGALARKKQRINLTDQIYSESEKEIGPISKRDLWLIGTALYWAEGSKEKEHKPGSGAKFSNSDPVMIKFFLLWLDRCCNISKKDMVFEIYIHDGDKKRIGDVITYWSKQIGVSEGCFDRIYYKRDKINTKRKNIGALYFGVLRVNIRQSSTLVRKIKGWVNGINKNCGIV